MSSTGQESASGGLGFDLSQFHEIFFEEAGENLDSLEQHLVAIDLASADDEALNAIFRCAHSIKGGAATFGFDDIAELTHQMESLLERLRRRELAPSAAMVDVLLQSADALKAQLARHQNGGKGAPIEIAALLQALRSLLAGDGAVAAAESAPAPAPAPAPEFAPAPAPAAAAPASQPAADDGFGFFDDPAETVAAAEPATRVANPPATAPAAGYPPPPATAPPFATATPARGAPAMPPAAEAATLRVSVEKVDQLINLVGELVITQAMLAQTSAAVDPTLYRQMATGLADLERNTRDLQESVMSIRMIPMSAVFNRFPRMLRDLAARLGKKVEFVTQGEATELDKGMIEKITDPLTHLVRNSCDHGIESPAQRLAAGKPETGTITLSASHQGGSIVIEVRDDGKGLSRETLLRKAREKGIHAPDGMSDAEAWDLIFAPGFSTAEVVSDVSGRGVGMDVVKKNITALGGRVEIESAEGAGMSVRVRLPLTLAIMDSMSVGIDTECYILPLSSVVESFQFSPDNVRTIGGDAQVVQVREQFLPVVRLDRVFGVARTKPEPERPILVIVEADGKRLALLVDELLGQQQVVVKNLESNYGKVDNVSGATIIGDGRVALILDIDSLVRRSRH
jgi:two-component system chemotaxis sensor kinase CheA